MDAIYILKPAFSLRDITRIVRLVLMTGPAILFLIYPLGVLSVNNRLLSIYPIY